MYVFLLKLIFLELKRCIKNNKCGPNKFINEQRNLNIKIVFYPIDNKLLKTYYFKHHILFDHHLIQL